MKQQVRPKWANLPEGNSGIDVEVVHLCEAMNLLPGIRTVESCCGHGVRPFHIWFDATRLDVLPALCYYFDGCHCGFYGWHVEVTTDCAMSPVHFLVEGPVGEEAYKQAELIALLIARHVLDDPVPVRRYMAKVFLWDTIGHHDCFDEQEYLFAKQQLEELEEAMNPCFDSCSAPPQAELPADLRDDR